MRLLAIITRASHYDPIFMILFVFDKVTDRIFDMLNIFLRVGPYQIDLFQYLFRRNLILQSSYFLLIDITNVMLEFCSNCSPVSFNFFSLLIIFFRYVMICLLFLRVTNWLIQHFWTWNRWSETCERFAERCRLLFGGGWYSCWLFDHINGLLNNERAKQYILYPYQNLCGRLSYIKQSLHFLIPYMLYSLNGDM